MGLVYCMFVQWGRLWGLTDHSCAVNTRHQFTRAVTEGDSGSERIAVSAQAESVLLSFLCLCICVCLPNSRTPCAPPAAGMSSAVGRLANIQKSFSFVTGPSSTTSQQADGYTQPARHATSPHFFHSCANKCKRNFNLLIVLASKPEVQRVPLSFMAESLPVFVRVSGL